MTQQDRRDLFHELTEVVRIISRLNKQAEPRKAREIPKGDNIG